MHLTRFFMAQLPTWLLAGFAIAQIPVTSNRFFIAEPRSLSAATIREYDAQGTLVGTHDLSSQLPAGFATNVYDHLNVFVVTPSGRLLCGTGFHVAGGWFEVDAQGTITTFYPNAGSNSQGRGAFHATALPGGGIIGAHYDWQFGGGRLRRFNSAGSLMWSSVTNYPMAPAVVGQTVYVGHDADDPITPTLPLTTWQLNGLQSGVLGSHVYAHSLKAIPGGKLLVGDFIQGQDIWSIRDLATGVVAVIDTSPFTPPFRHADVDDAGVIWILSGSGLIKFPLGSTSASLVVALGGFQDGVGLAVSGAPMQPVASYAVFGSGCQAPSGQVPSLAAVAGDLPRIGTSSRLRVSNLPLSVTIPVFILGFSNSQATGAYGNYPLPQDLGILGWPGCDQLVSLNDSIFTITTTGYADHTVTIPAFPFLVGMQFHAQVLVLYAPSGVAVSNAVTGTVGY